MAIVFRAGTQADLDAAARIYEAVFDRQEGGEDYTNWLRGVYPTRDSAKEALEAGTFYVAEEEGRVGAVANLNHCQLPEYEQGDWSVRAEGEQVMVIHTLCVDPAWAGRGVGAAFVSFAEELGRKQGCRTLRLDTFEGNRPARRLYTSLGYRQAGIVDCLFMDGRRKNLVLFEKTLLSAEENR